MVVGRLLRRGTAFRPLKSAGKNQGIVLGVPGRSLRLEPLEQRRLLSTGWPEELELLADRRALLEDAENHSDLNLPIVGTVSESRESTPETPVVDLEASSSDDLSTGYALQGAAGGLANLESATGTNSGNSGQMTTLGDDSSTPWAIGFGGFSQNYSLTSSQAQAVADWDGNLYVAGHFDGTRDFDPGVGVCLLESRGGHNGYVAKYSPAGGLVWVKQVVSSDSVAVDDVDLDNSGNIYITGKFKSNVTFDSAVFTGTGFEGFIAKYTSHGTLVWARHIGQGEDWFEPYSIVVDKLGSIYVTGRFRGSAQIAPYSFVTQGFAFDVFVASFRGSDGETLWAQAYGSEDGEEGWRLAFGDAGDLYVSGTMGGGDGVVEFGPYRLTGPANFVARFRTDNGDVVWAQSIYNNCATVFTDIAV